MARTLSNVLTRPEFWRGEWGVSDCLHWALTAAAAAGGQDLTPQIPRYRTRIGALRALTRMGFRTAAEALDHFAERIPSSRARPGNVCMTGEGRLGAFGVVIGADALFLSANGLSRLPVRGLPCWRV